MPLPRLPSLRGERCSSNCWGSGARSCRGEVAEAVSGGDEIEIAPMVAASRFHVMGVGGGLNVSWKNLCTMRWNGQITQVMYITQVTDIVVVMGNLLFGLLCLCSATREVMSRLIPVHCTVRG